jgi:hypothetical protein
MDKVEIKTVNIQVGKKQLNLTVEEAKKLKGVLEELFGKEVVKEVKEIHHHDYYPYRWWWYTPQWESPNTTPVFYCSNGTAQVDNNALQITC